MSNFIVSGKGFYKSISFNRDGNQHDIEWTYIIRDAQTFKSKSALDLINKHKLDAFVWKPYVEEPIIGKWLVEQRRDHSYLMGEDNEHKVLEWKPNRVVGEKKTDVKFLTSKGIDDKTYYDSYEDALEVCQIKNLEIINELQEKMNKMNLKNIKSKNNE